MVHVAHGQAILGVDLPVALAHVKVHALAERNRVAVTRRQAQRRDVGRAHRHHARQVARAQLPVSCYLPSTRRRGRSSRRATTNCDASTFPATGQAPSPLGLSLAHIYLWPYIIISLYHSHLCILWWDA